MPGKSRAHVYFNKSKNGRSRYKSGYFFSKKNGKNMLYRSAYELAFMARLELDENVLSYAVEPMKIPFTGANGKHRTYIPDFLILLADGSMKLVEVKPTAMLSNADVQRKAQAAHIYLRRNMSKLNITFMFVTEEDIFSSKEQYKQILEILNE